jgi:hypothetical protein
MFSRKFSKKFPECRLRATGNIGENFMAGQPPEPRRVPPKRKETDPVSSPGRTTRLLDGQAPDSMGAEHWRSNPLVFQ